MAQPCPAGSAKAKAGNAPCAKCPSRTYQPSKKQLSCKACPSGKRVNAAKTACIAYGPGVQPGRLNAPEKCPAGDWCGRVMLPHIW
jgi:Tyrosine-protein kinase ephrin type A/B receptor-like